MPDTRRAPRAVVVLEGLVREIRPWQWYKQSVMCLGIVFSRNVFDVGAWLDLTVGIVAFTAFAGTAYILNDINDLEQDRNHPRKRHRPIASGQVSPRLAGAFALVLVALGVAAAYSLGPLFLAVLLSYIAVNVCYSSYLKRIAFVDVIAVAVGFVLRAVAGVVAIDVFLSPWLIVTTFLLALVLAIGKRRNEVETVANPGETRHILAEYAESDLDQLLVMSMSTLLMAYTLYSFSRRDSTMLLTLPFAFFGVFRYHHLVHTTDVAGEPEYLFTDLPSAVNLVLWTAVVVGVLYDVPQLVVGVFT